MKKQLLMIFTAMLLFILAACGQTASTDSKASDTKTDKDEPQIASLSIHLTNDLLALGITPVGSVVGGELNDFLPHVKDLLKDTAKLGPAKDPDMEAVIALDPSVIYIDEGISGEDISKFEDIAPTESFNLDEGTWRDHLKAIGKLVDRTQEAEDFIADYENLTSEVKTLATDELGENSKVMAIRVTAKELRVFTTKRPLGPMLFDDLGFKPAAGIDELDSTQPYEVISQEVLPDFDADAIFVVVNSDDKAQTAFKQLEESPIYQGLKAAKNKHVYVVSDQPWLDYSALGNKLAMEEAKKLFSK
ncbi:ABC transporter substrate-binding protein [Niallia taxi]|uniref:Iron-hydroxamate ABC transporter substrate-binding protein n=1 Tax=Niallia taxi TaxID=2499688 RepID=A0A3S2U9R8_9BACI|nr:ABC transporter substrate-binding protein [Niallia taxi]MCM3213414.1 ABC transporter substrate-binding protein [Niallia taxi]MED4056448.1 ABC transporter substrate-binding protein [Niallia taxi]MED4118712.1 ABC transporter substrate-binding protein [Niallia taxi]RVT62419.1 iron-hydroxamate ABC transporter substrate-binding protein [Niallia taxi]